MSVALTLRAEMLVSDDYVAGVVAVARPWVVVV